MRKNPFVIGDKVYRNFPFDGAPKQGYPDRSRIFTIVKIDDYNPIDGPQEKTAVCHLSPGVTWSYWWNLTPTK